MKMGKLRGWGWYFYMGNIGLYELKMKNIILETFLVGAKRGKLFLGWVQHECQRYLICNLGLCEIS